MDVKQKETNIALEIPFMLLNKAISGHWWPGIIKTYGITLEFQIDHTVGKNLHGWKNNIDNGARATEMCPDIKAIGIWLSAIESLKLAKCFCYFPAV